MFGRLFGRKGPKPDRPLRDDNPFTNEDVEQSTVGDVVARMAAAGYQGPFANMCDGVSVMTFHARGVSLSPDWIETDQTPFRMRVLNSRAFAENSPMVMLGDAAGNQDRVARAADGTHLREKSIPASITTPCLLTYPYRGTDAPEGQVWVAERTEDLWNVHQFGDYLYFSRSWNGHLHYRARVYCREGSMTITAVEASPSSPPRSHVPETNDPRLPVRQVDFLLKMLVYGCPSPAPLPADLAGENEGTLALWALTEYGRWGWFPTFEDTTEYRLGLNGVADRMPAAPAQRALLDAVQAVEANDNPTTRRALHERLRAGQVFLSFAVPADVREAIQAGRSKLSEDTPIEFQAQPWQGGISHFVYTDRAYRMTRGGGAMEFAGPDAFARLLAFDDGADAVINPGGPWSCRLTRAELQLLAKGGSAG